eukprot:2905386-Alexandrium_andersonii.AAC.1
MATKDIIRFGRARAFAPIQIWPRLQSKSPCLLLIVFGPGVAILDLPPLHLVGEEGLVAGVP